MRSARAWIVWAWPFLAAFAVSAVVVAATVAVWSIFDQRAAEEEERNRVARLAGEVRRVAEATKAAAETNTQILSDIRQAEQRRQPLVDAAIKRIIADNAEAHAALLGQIARLINRPVPKAPPRLAPVPPAPAAPRAGGSPGVPPTTGATTTTTCPKRGKSGQCR